MFINVIRSNHPTITKHGKKFACDALETNNVREEAVPIVKEFVDKLNGVKKNFLAHYLIIPYIFLLLALICLIIAIFVGVLVLIAFVIFLALFIGCISLSFYMQRKYLNECKVLVQVYTEKLTDHYLVVDSFFSYDRAKYKRHGRSYDVEKTIHLIPIESKEKYTDPDATFLRQQQTLMDELTNKSHANENIPVYKIKEQKDDVIQIEEYRTNLKRDTDTVNEDNNEQNALVPSK